MSTSDQIYLATGLSPRDTARRLADVLGMTFREDGNGCYVYRHTSEGDVVVELGGPVDRNWHHAEAGPERVPGDASVMDGYDVEWDVHLYPGDEDELHRRTRALFEDVVRELRQPAVLVHDTQVLVAAARDGGPVVELPPDTSPLAMDRGRWATFALPR